MILNIIIIALVGALAGQASFYLVELVVTGGLR